MLGFGAGFGSLNADALRALFPNLNIAAPGKALRIEVPYAPEYVERPVVLQTPNRGNYRPYIPALDRVQAVFLAPVDPTRDANKSYGLMTENDIALPRRSRSERGTR